MNVLLLRSTGQVLGTAILLRCRFAIVFLPFLLLMNLDFPWFLFLCGAPAEPSLVFSIELDHHHAGRGDAHEGLGTVLLRPLNAGDEYAVVLHVDALDLAFRAGEITFDDFYPIPNAHADAAHPVLLPEILGEMDGKHPPPEVQRRPEAVLALLPWALA